MVITPCDGACAGGGGGSELFSDDFADGTITGWTKLSGETMAESGGVFQTTSDNNTTTHYSVDSGSSWTDYTFSVDHKARDNDLSRFTFRVQDSSNYYQFTQGFADNDLWNLRLQKVVAGTAFSLASAIDNEGSSAGQVNSETTWYSFKVTVSGTSIKAYVDDVLKFDITDSTFSSGTVGLALTGQKNSEFDNVLVVDETPAPPGETFYILSRDSDTQVTIQGTASATATDETYTIERAYNTFQAWEDDREGDLVTDDRFEVGVAYDDGDFTAGAVIAGSTTDATHYMKVTVEASQRHAGVAGAGVVINAGGGVAGDIFAANDPYTRIDGLQITNYKDGAGSDGVSVGAANVLLEDLLVYDFDTANGIRFQQDGTLRNSIFYDGANGVLIVNGATATIENVTIYGMTVKGILDDNTVGNTAAIRNTISVGNTTADFDLPQTINTFSNNMYSTATGFTPAGYPGGQSPPANLDDLFVTITAGLEDLHLETSGHLALGTGLDLSASFGDDIDGDTRTSGVCSGWDLGADESSGAGSVCHFAISHDGTGINCQAEPVTITYHDSTHNRISNYTGTITLSTSIGHGDWSLMDGSGTLTNSGNGDATYTFSSFDNGQVILGLKDTFVETANIDVTDGSIVEDSGDDPDLTFANTGFVFLADSTANAIGIQIGGKASNLAPGAQTIELQAIKTSDQTGACEAALVGSQQILLGYRCVNPGTCSSARMDVNGGSIEGNDFSNSLLSYAALPLNFGSDTDSTATLAFSFPDVGKVQLLARHTLSPSGELMLGSSNVFIVRPFAIDVSVSGNPGATDPTGGVLTTAGTPFTATVRAVLWDAADDSNSDGQADGHGDTDPTNNTNLVDNATALSFGQEAPGGESIVIGADLVAPAAGNSPALAGGTVAAGYVSGIAGTTGLRFDEVGVIELRTQINDGNYLDLDTAETAKIWGRSSYVGRFTPAAFDVSANTPLFGTTCGLGGFSYLGDTFTFATAPVITVTAQNANGVTTQNYTGAWIKMTSTDLSGRTYLAATGTLDTSGLPSSADPAVADSGSGTVSLTFGSGTGLFFQRGDPVAPFSAEIEIQINVADFDGITYGSNPARVGQAAPGLGIGFDAGKTTRWGRLAFENAYGSELVDLPVPLHTEYFDGVSWVRNTDDECTNLTTTDLNMTPVPGGLSSTPTIGNAPVASGDAGLSLGAPGLNNVGRFDLEFDISATGADFPYLFYDWDGDLSHDNSPTARASFGLYSGRPTLIYVRELY